MNWVENHRNLTWQPWNICIRHGPESTDYGFTRLNSTSLASSSLVSNITTPRPPQLTPSVHTWTVTHPNSHAPAPERSLTLKHALSFQPENDSLNTFRVLLRKPLNFPSAPAWAIQLLFLMRTSNMQSHPSSSQCPNSLYPMDCERHTGLWLTSEAVLKKKSWKGKESRSLAQRRHGWTRQMQKTDFPLGLVQPYIFQLCWCLLMRAGMGHGWHLIVSRCWSSFKSREDANGCF